MLIVGETTAALETYEIKLVYGDPDCITIRCAHGTNTSLRYVKQATQMTALNTRKVIIIAGMTSR